jgi:hypothetical protein
MIKEEYKYSDITEKIIGCAMKVRVMAFRKSFIKERLL